MASQPILPQTPPPPPPPGVDPAFGLSLITNIEAEQTKVHPDLFEWGLKSVLTPPTTPTHTQPIPMHDTNGTLLGYVPNETPRLRTETIREARLRAEKTRRFSPPIQPAHTPAPYSGLGYLKDKWWEDSIVKRSYEMGWQQAEVARIRNLEMLGKATQSDIARADELSKISGTTQQILNQYGFFEGMPLASLSQAPFMIGTLASAQKYGAAGAMIGGGLMAAAGQAGPQIALPEELLTVPAGASVGYSLGAAYGSLKFMKDLEGGLLYDELRNIPGVSKTKAVAVSEVGGWFNAAAEYLSMGLLLRGTGLEKFIGSRGINKPFTWLINTKMGKNLLTRFIGGAGIRIAGEGLQESVQELPGVVGGAVLRGQPKEMFSQQSLSRLMEAGRMGAQAAFIPGGAAQVADTARASWSGTLEGVKGAPPPVIGASIPDSSAPSGPGALSYLSATQGAFLTEQYDSQWTPAERAALKKIDDYTRTTGDTLPQQALAALPPDAPKETIAQVALQLAEPLQFSDPIPEVEDILRAPAPSDPEFIADPRKSEAIQVVQANEITRNSEQVVGFIQLNETESPDSPVAVSLPVLQIEGRLFTTHPTQGGAVDITRSLKPLGLINNGTAWFLQNPSAGIRYEPTEDGNLRLVPGQIQEEAPAYAQAAPTTEEAPPPTVPEVPTEDLVQTGPPPEGTIPQVLQQPGAVALARAPKPGHSPRGARYSAQSGPAKRAAAAFAFRKPKIPRELFNILTEDEKVQHIVARMQDAAQNFSWEELSHLDPNDLAKLSYAQDWSPTPTSVADLNSAYDQILQHSGFKSRTEVKKTPSAISPASVDAFVQRTLADPDWLDIQITSDPKKAADTLAARIQEVAQYPGEVAFDTLMTAVTEGFNRDLARQQANNLPVDDLHRTFDTLTKSYARIIHGDQLATQNEYDVLGDVTRNGLANDAQRQLKANALNLHVQALGLGRIMTNLLRADETIGFRRESAEAIAISQNAKKILAAPLNLMHRAYRTNEQEVSLTFREIAHYLKAFAANPEFARAVSVAMSSDRTLALTKTHDQIFKIKQGLKTREYSVHDTVKFFRDDFFPRYIKGDGTGRLEQAYIKRLAFQSNVIRAEMDKVIERLADDVVSKIQTPWTPEFAGIMDKISSLYGQPDELLAWLQDETTQKALKDALKTVTFQGRKAQSGLKSVLRGVKNLQVLAKAAASREAKIAEAKSGELKRMNYFTALHFYTNDAFRDQLSSAYTPTMQFGITPNMPDDYLRHRDSKTRPYMSPEVELMFYIPLASRMIHIEPAFHQFFTKVNVEGYVSPFVDKERSTLKRGMLTGNEVVDAIWLQIEDLWKNLQGQINPIEGNLQRANMQVATLVGRKTLPSVLGDMVGLKTSELAQKKPLAVPDPRITMSWGKILQLYSYATLLDPISLAVVNGLDVAFNAWRISAMKSPTDMAKAAFYFMPKGFLSAMGQISREAYNRGKYAVTGKFDPKLTPEVFRFGSLTMMAELDEMMFKHKRGLQTVQEGAASRAMNLIARTNMMGGRLGDMMARVTTFEATRLHLIHLGVDPTEAGWLAADETAWLHGTAGPLGDAPRLYSSTFLRLTIRHLSTYMRMRIGQEIMFAKTAAVRTSKERAWKVPGYNQRFIENSPAAGEYGQLGMITLPDGSQVPAPRTAEEQEAEMYQGMEPLLGGPLVRPSDAAIWAARRQLILGNAAALTALAGMTYGLGWSLWKALFIPAKIGLAAFAGISQAVEHASLAGKKLITSTAPGQSFDWTQANQARLDYLNDNLEDYIPIYGPGHRGLERMWENNLKQKGIDPKKTPYGRAKAREKRLRSVRRKQEANRQRNEGR